MRTRFWLMAIAAAATSATLAATRTWIGGTGNQTWGTASNWQNGAVPQDGDTAVINKSVNFTAAVTLPSNIVFNIGSGCTVKFTGVVSGAGGVTRSGGSGDLQFTGKANTYDGPTTVSSSTFRFANIANIGVACSLGKPTTAEKAKLTINAAARLNGGGTCTTDRPIELLNSSQFYIDSGTLIVNGPYTGKGYTRGGGQIQINTYLAPDSINNCSRTDVGISYFTCPTNAFTCGISIADGIFRGPSLTDKNMPCAFGAGTTISMGQQNWATTGTLCYNGPTNVTCNRDITINVFTNSSATANHWGGRFRNETAGTCMTMNGSLSFSVNTKYPQSTPALFLGGVGDGVFAAPLTGRAALYKEDAGTWTVLGAHTASGLVDVKGGRLNVDGSIPATSTVDTKVTTLEMRETRLCSSAICTWSASLVKRLMSSPWVWASKYFRGSSCSLSKRSRRRRLHPF